MLFKTLRIFLDCKLALALFITLQTCGFNKKVTSRLLLAISLCLPLMTAPAWAKEDLVKQDNPQAEEFHLSYEELDARWAKLYAEQKIIVLFQLVKKGEFERAQGFLDTTKFGGGSALDAQFLQALIYQNTGKHEEAAAGFREILTDHPNNQTARLQLAHTLYLMKEDVSARHHFELALGSVSDPDTENVIRNFVDQIDRRKRLQIDAYVSIAPSTNFNQGTAQDIVYLNGRRFRIGDQGQAKSGLGLRGGFNVGYRIPLADRLDLVTSAGVNVREYDKDTYDDQSISAQVGPRYSFTLGSIGVYATMNQRWFGGKAYSKSTGVRAHIRTQMTKRAISSFTAGYNLNRYETAKHSDGSTYYGSGYIDYYFSNASYARLLGGAAKSSAQYKHLDYISWNGGIGLYRELPWGVSLYAQARYTKRNYDGIFPFLTTSREDKQIDLTGSLTKRDWNWRGFAPKFEYGYKRNISNVGLYDYNSHDVNVTLSKKF